MTATTKMEMQPKKKSFFGRLRGRTREKEDTRDQTPSPSEQPAADATSMTSPAAAAAAASTPKLFADSNVLNRDNHDTTMKAAPRLPEADARKPHKQLPIRKRHELLKPPTAREAAYGGPPRYDWIDIVSSSLVVIMG